MSFSHAVLWFGSVIFVILPRFNLGLLSDYKICGDSECESLMSRVQAIRDHRGKDCRFLSFRRGDTIFVYHKLTGKREDLWAGTIDRKFGYFPKDAVQEEQVYATTQKVVETQKSDFICMDESGYPIDSSHLDNSDEDGDQNQNIHGQESETIQTIVHTDDTSAEHPSTSIDSLSESLDQPDATSGEEDKNRNFDITAPATREDTHETPAALGEQGGSPSSSWLGSSVTGWLGLGKEEQTGNMPEREEPQAEASLTSSVTGWLGFGGEKKLDDTVNNREEDKEVDASFTSTMTGWLGLGGEKKADATKHQHEEKEIDDESEPKETFRSRRMSLDLEGSQLQEEEKEVGTLDWLGNGLSSTLGFGLKNQESDPVKQEKEKPTSRSWLDIGVGDIWGFGKPKSEVDERTRSNFKQTEKDTTLEEATLSDQAEISQSQPVQGEQKKTQPDVQRLEDMVGMETLQEDNVRNNSSKDTNELNVEERVEDHFSHSEMMSDTVTRLEEDNNTITTAASDGSEGNSLPDDQKDKSTETTSEESWQASGGRTTMMDEEGSAEAMAERHEIHKSTGNDSGNNNRALQEEEIKTASDDREITQLNTDLGSDCYSTESKGEYEANTDEGQQESKTVEHLEDDKAKITDQVENREESTVVVLELGGRNDADEEERSNAERDVPTVTESAEPIPEEGSRGQSHSSSSSDTDNQEKEPTDSEDDSFTAHSVKADNSGTVTITEDNREAHSVENTQGFQSFHSTNASGLSFHEKPSEDQMLAPDIIIHSKDPEPGSFENEEVIELKEMAKQEEFEEKMEVKDGERQQIMEESEQKGDNTKEEEMEEEVHELQEKQDDVKTVKEEEKHGEMKEVEEEVHQDGKQELKNEEIQGGDNVQEEMRQEELQKGGENEIQEVKELKEEEKGGDEVALMEKQKHDEVEESVEEETRKMLNDVKEEENQVQTEAFQVEEKEAELEEAGKGKKLKEQEEQQQTIVRSKGELRGEKRQEEIQTSKEEENQEKFNQLNGLKEKENEKDKETTVQGPEDNKREEEQMKHDNVEESKEEKTAGDEMQQVPDVEGDGRNNEEEESHECSNKPSHQAPEDEPAGVRNENVPDLRPSSADDSMIQQKLNEQISENETISTEGTETDRLREEQPETAKADEGEKADITLNATGNENIYNNNVNISKHNGLKVEQIGAASHTDTDQHVAGESQEHMSQGPVGSGVKMESEGGGAFGLFKNAFGFFSQTPVTKTKEPTASSMDTESAETSPPQAFLTLEQDSTANSNQEDKDSPVGTSAQQHRQAPPASAPSPSPETSPQTKSLAKYYKNLLSRVGVEELTYLVDLFGRNKLQFLDYILGSSENHTGDPDHDESILSDIERLLHHHRETLAASQGVNEKTALNALQKLEMLLEKMKEAFNTRKSDVSKANVQADASCVGASCSADGKDKKEPQRTQDFSVPKDTKAQREKRKAEETDNGQAGAGGTRESRDTEVWKGAQKKTHIHPHIQRGSAQPQEGLMKQSLDFMRQIVTDSVTYAHATREVLLWLSVQVVSSLPDDLRPGPDLYGLPWEPVIISSLVGLVTVLLFTCRCYRSVKSRIYRSKELWMAEQVAQLLEEKCKVLETLSKCQQEYDELEDSLRDSGVLAQTQKTEQLEIKARQVEDAKRELKRDLGQLKDQLEQQREHRLEQEKKIAVLEENMKALEDETKDLQSQEEQAQTTLKVYSMNSDRLQRNLETAGEESTLLQDSNAQLRQQAEGWAERVSELEAEIRRCEVAYSGMQQHVANKDERILSLTDHLLRMKAWDSDLEDNENEEEEKKEASNGTAAKLEGEREDISDTQGHLQKVQKLIYAAKLNADLKSLDEDKDRVFAKLNDEVKAKEDLQESIKELENEKLSLQSDAEQYSDQVQRLQQKLHIMTEMYQENELKLHRLLTVEERERLQKEEKLNKADKNIALAIEEVNNYRQRAEEMEEELEKTKQSYQTQISAHEKKAHNNWLAARAAERDLADIRRENALLRQKLTDTQFKLDAIDKDPYALDSLARPLPFRAERSPYGPSPLGRPASETRAFLSPPTLLDGPPARLSPRMSHGPVEPSANLGEFERSGGPHSDSGSISPTWDRDRRGPPPGPPGSIGLPGYMFPEPGGPMYRRPLPPPGAIGILPPGPLLPHPRGFLPGPPSGPPHSTDIPDRPYSESNTGPIEQQHRESGSGDRRTPPEADLRMGGPLPPGPPMGSMDGPFPRRTPYGPPPPEFYPPRGPGGPAMRPMWAPPPSGMMFPPRFPPSGPPLSNAPHPHYAPAMRPVAPDRLPPPSMGPPPAQQSLPFPPHSQSSDEHATSPEDAI